MKLVRNISSILTSSQGGGFVAGPAPAPAPQDGGGFDFMSALSTGLSLASASAQIFGARERADFQVADAEQKSKALFLQAREQELEAKREEIRGKQEGNEILDSLRQTIAQQQLGFAAGGVDIGFGTPLAEGRTARELASRRLSTSRSDATIRAITRRRQGAALREEGINTATAGRAKGKITRQEGGIKALGTVTETINRRVRRG